MARLFVVRQGRDDFDMLDKAPRYAKGGWEYPLTANVDMVTKKGLKAAYGLTTLPRAKEYVEVDVTVKVVKVHKASLNGNGKGGK